MKAMERVCQQHVLPQPWVGNISSNRMRPAALVIEGLWEPCMRSPGSHLHRKGEAGAPAAVGGVHRPAEVGDLELALGAQQQVLGFDVAVDDVLGVAVQQRAA